MTNEQATALVDAAYNFSFRLHECGGTDDEVIAFSASVLALLPLRFRADPLIKKIVMERLRSASDALINELQAEIASGEVKH